VVVALMRVLPAWCRSVLRRVKARSRAKVKARSAGAGGGASASASASTHSLDMNPGPNELPLGIVLLQKSTAACCPRRRFNRQLWSAHTHTHTHTHTIHPHHYSLTPYPIPMILYYTQYLEFLSHSILHITYVHKSLMWNSNDNAKFIYKQFVMIRSQNHKNRCIFFDYFIDEFNIINYSLQSFVYMVMYVCFRILYITHRC